MPTTIAVNQDKPVCKSFGDGQREVVNDSEALNDSRLRLKQWTDVNSLLSATL